MTDQGREPDDPPATGFRAVIRGALYQNYKLELGCPTEAKCSLIQLNAEACSGCSKLLKPVEPEPPIEALSRVAFLVKLESLHNIGCTFGVDDLPWAVWEERLMLAIERQRMERLMREQKDGAAKSDRDTDRSLAEARKLSGVPPPGQSLFGGRGRR